MGILDDILGGVLGGATGQSTAGQPRAAGGGGAGSVLVALLPIAISMLTNRQGGPPPGAAPSGGGGLGGVLGSLVGAGSRRGGGGLGQILEQFQRAGFGREAASWVSTGENMPISPEAIGQVFGGDALSRIARQADISEAEASSGLSQLLPELVDRVTPSGQVPDLAQLAASVEALQRRIGA